MLIFLSCVFGAAIGSFLNVLILRLPHEQSLGGRSHCPHCHHQLHAVDLVPVLSWLWLAGHCQYCHKRISSRYFWIETVTAALFGLCAWKFGAMAPDLASLSFLQILQIARAFFIVAILVVVFMTDLEHFLILDSVILPGTLLLMFMNFFVDVVAANNFNNSLLVAGLFSGLMLFCFFGVLHFISHGRWMGFGDVKFAFFLGLATPFPFLFGTVFLAFGLGAVVGILLLLARFKKIRSEVPFGTFLAIATVVMILYGPQIVNWYLRLAGFGYLAHY